MMGFKCGHLGANCRECNSFTTCKRFLPICGSMLAYSKVKQQRTRLVYWDGRSGKTVSISLVPRFRLEFLTLGN